MMKRLLVTILLVSQLALALHYEIHERQSHQATDEVYQNGLIELEKKLIKSMGDTQDEFDSLTQTVKTSSSTSGLDLAALNSRLNEQREALDEVEDYIKVPLTPRPCNSTPQAIQTRDALRKKSDELSESVKAFKKQLANCAHCKVTTDLNQMILQQQNYITVINEVTDSNCTKAPEPLPPQKPTGLVDLSESQYKNNLQAKNWVFGNITEDEYKYQVFENSIKNNLTSCPIATPFVNPKTHLCFNCPQGLKFNLGKKVCETCPENFTFNLDTGLCKSPCDDALEVYNDKTKKCQPKPTDRTDSMCPLDKPIWDSVSKSCKLCPSATPVFNNTSKKCEACPESTTWVDAESKCVKQCPEGEEVDPDTNECVNKSQCPEGQAWNNQTLRCEIHCKDGFKVNPRTDACEKVEPKQCDDLKPIWNSTSLECQICPEEIPVWNKTEKKCDPCPKELPVYDYSLFKCVEKICDPGFKWNKAMLECASIEGNCTKEQLYSFENQTCVDKCEKNHSYIKSNDSCQCFPERPIFNAKTRKCQDPKCNQTGDKWNEQLKKCVALKGNCSVSQEWNFTIAQCVDKCEAGVAYIESNDSCKCPPQLPTFNKTTRKCQEGVCDKKDEKWNMNLKKCSPISKNCSQWQLYDFNTEICENKCEENHTYLKQNDTCQCTAEYPLFDPATRTCMKPICPKGHAWNKDLIKCSEINEACQTWEDYDFKTEQCVKECEVNQTYFEKFDNCSCTAEKPAFNKTTRKCQEPICQDGFKFSKIVLKCLNLTGDCKSWQQYNSSTGLCMDKCQLNQTYFPGNDTCTCPPERPYYDASNPKNKSCSSPPCPRLTAWNEKLLQCTYLTKQCELWQLYVFEQGKCIDKCPVNHTYIEDENRCTCEAETPEYDNQTKTCVEPICPEGYLWNKFLIKCSEIKKKCDAWQIYDFEVEECQQKCEPNITYVSRYDQCLCPPEKPLLSDERKCIQPNCTEGYKYNTYLIKCSSIEGNCSKEALYNFTDESCTTRCQANHTYIKETDGCTCSPQIPHFDNVTRTCVEPVCPDGHKWNRHLIKCSLIDMKCEKWQQFNFTLEKCVNKCEEGHTFFTGDNTCECFPEAPHFDPNTRKCTIPACAQGFFWNTYLHKCSITTGSCQTWQIYNATTESCVTKCKINQQYHKDTDSCQCTAQFPLFDHKTDQCIQPPCPDGYRWNKLKTKCSLVAPEVPCLKWQFYDFLTEECIARCEINHTYYAENDTCECFADKPNFNLQTRKCQIPTCTNDTKWNAYLMRCVSIYGDCQKWQVYNFTDQTCITMCDNHQMYYPNNDTCHCYPADPIFNRKTRKCEEPICWYGQGWDRVNYRCHCNDGYEFNQTVHTCQLKCQDGYFLNYTSNQCEFIVIVPICGSFMFVNASNQCQCLGGYVSSDGGVNCHINCPAGYLYNFTTKQCDKIVCPEGYYYDLVTRNCEKKQITCPAGFFYSAKINKCVSCPAGFVFNETLDECVASINNICPENYTFNPQTRLCDPPVIIDTTCPSGYYYDYNMKQCRLKYITSPTAGNLITENMTKYKEYYDAQKRSNSGLTDCVSPTPFYDKNGFRCITCPADFPYFNLDLNKCENCGSLHFNSNTFKCEKTPTQKHHYDYDATIGRFLANVI